MPQKLNIQLILVPLFLSMLILYSLGLSSQSLSNDESNWVHSVSFGIGTNNEFDSPYEFEGTQQIEYGIYKFLNPRFALGGGVSIARHGGLYGYHNHVSTHYFGDVFIYGKFYLLNERRSLYADLKLGYGTGLGSEKFKTYMNDLDPNAVVIYELLPGYMIQSGLGFEFESLFGQRLSMKLSPHLIQTARRADRKIYIGAIIFVTSLYF